MKQVLITGGAGFIGSRLALALLERGYTVTVLDSLSPQVHGDTPETSALYRSIVDRVRFLRGSVTDEADWIKALEGQDAVVHLAAETGTGQSMYEIKRYVDVNVGGTALLLNVLANHPRSVRKVVVASSRALYGEGKYASADGILYPGPRSAEDMRAGRFEIYAPAGGAALRALATDEESKIHPASVYGITKQGQEQLVMTVCPTLGVAATALRYQNVFGPGQSLSNPYTGILSIFSTRLLNGKPIEVYEDGKESRDFVYVDDAVRATVLALQSDRANGQVFGIGSGVPTPVLDAAEGLRAHLAAHAEINITGAFRLGDIRTNYADLTKARQLLDFSPQVDFAAGLANFAAWVRQQPLQRDNYDRSLGELRTKGLIRS